MDELAVELGRDPMELRRQNWIKHEEFPFTTVVRPDLRHGQLRAVHRPGHGHVRLRGAAPRAGGAAAQRRSGPARHRHLDVHRDVRHRALAAAGVAGLRRRRLGGREHPDAGHRQGRGDHRRVRARARTRDGLQPDRRRPARRAVRGRRDPARRHPHLAEGPGHLRVAVPGGRRHRDRQRGTEGRDEGQEARGAPARGVGGRHRVRERHVQRPRHRQGQGDPGARVRRVHGARLPGGHGTQPRRRRCRSTRRTSRSRTARTSPPSRSTPRPGTSTCASTSAWTTSATSSTR